MSLLPTSTIIMPQPFAWVNIPAGNVKLEDFEETFNVETFQIAKYPVTTAQYRVFMTDGGYKNENYWTPIGWAWCKNYNMLEPRGWADADMQERFFQPNQPIIQINWYEAMAFCAWLRAKTGENIHLPSEQQWQRAAEGDAKLIYPWGNDWDGGRCNHNVYDNYRERWNTSSTTSVTTYEGKGDSSFGVVDMAGNVCEWCLTDYKTGLNNAMSNATPSVRGSSWRFREAIFFRTTNRAYDYAFAWDLDIGFRLARS